MRNVLNIGVALMVGFGLGLLVMQTLKRPESSKVTITKADEEKVKSIFSSGCEIGIMKYCEVSKQEDCKKFCLLFLEANPDVVGLLLKGLN